jgi:hypothetical protein
MRLTDWFGTVVLVYCVYPSGIGFAVIPGAIALDVQPGAPVFRPLSSEVTDPSVSIQTSLPTGVSLGSDESKSVLNGILRIVLAVDENLEMEVSLPQ